MLSTILEPTTGSIEIDGIDAIENHKKVKNKINVITGGEKNLYWRLTAKENLEYFGSLYNINKKELDSKITKLLRIVGLEDAKDLTVERFSKGMKQRLQIARGLINDPDYLFLDEPTVGLDISFAKEVRQYIRKLAVDENKGMLLTSHYISEVEELCDYIYIIDKGKVIAQGTNNQVKKMIKANDELLINVVDGIDQTEKMLNNSNQYHVKSVDKDNKNIIITLFENSVTPDIIKRLTDEKIKINEIKLLEPSLEDAILDILGRCDRK